MTSGGNVTSRLAWYENLGSGIFSSHQTISTQVAYSADVYSADLDNDGDMDVISVGGSGTIYNGKLAWYENLGGGLFGSQQILFSNTGAAFSVFAADLDLDGDIEIISIKYQDDELVIFENLGGGIFGPQQIISKIFKSPVTVFSGDIDNDGDKDLISGNTNNKVVWYENLGAKRFSTEKTISDTSINSLITSIFASDVNNDGNIDVLTASVVNHTIAWHENLGGGNFGNGNIITTNAKNVRSIYVVDLDNDGDGDVLSASSLDNKIAWHENLGSGIIDTTPKIITVNALYARSVYSVDIDMDGDMDVLSASSGDDKIAWYENLGSGIIDTTQHIITTIADGACSVYAADLNNDGNIDVLSASFTDNKVAWYENLGGGIFGSQQVISNLNNFPSSVRADDIDGDGFIDVMLASKLDDKIVWFKNLGGGLFDPQQVITTLTDGAEFVYSDDLDNDGDIDVISVSSVDHKIAWYENFFLSPFQLKGKTYFDMNQNGLLDTNENGFLYSQIQLQPLALNSFTTNNGDYFFSVDSGTYVLSYLPNSLWNLTSDSTTFTKTLSGLNPLIDSLNFGFYPDTLITNIIPSLTGGFPRCNDTINYWINVYNNGTTQPSGIIQLQLDDSVSYLSSLIPPDSIVGQNIYWSYDSLFFYSQIMIDVQVIMPPFTSMGDTLTSYLTVNELDTSSNVIYINTDSLSQVSVCAYDPNDKAVLPKGIGVEGFISNDEPFLEYLIRFQNTGNDTAITVMVRDQLDPNLDWNTITPIANSHSANIWIEQGGVVVFKFENIMLPDSGANFLGSQGFIKYRVNLKSNIIPGIQIHNTASIYFDNNPAIITNTVTNTIYDCNRALINISNSFICLGDVLEANSPEGDIISYLWEIDSFYSDSLSTLNWISDTVGIFNLKLTLDNSFCSKDTIVQITVLASTPLIYFSQDICQGDSILIYGTYQNTSGTYYDSLQTINGCDSILSTTLTVNPLPNVTITSFNPDTICSNGSVVTLPNGSPSGGVYSGTGVSGGNFDPNTAGIGTHSVIYTYTDINSCINSDSTFITVEQCVGIDDLENDLGILIYPNPNTGLFTIEKSSELDKEVRISLLDASSRVIINKIIPKGQQKIEMDITNYSKGVYYLQLTIGDKVYVKQILKN